MPRKKYLESRMQIFLTVMKDIKMTFNPKLKLIYFKMRALAEAPQILMRTAGI